MTSVLGRRAFLQAAGGVAVGAVLGSCRPARQGARGGRPTVRVVGWTALGYPSPFTYTAGPGYWRMSLLFDTLTWSDASGRQLPWLAASYRRSEDGLVYSLDLREVRWDDGRPLTARDVVFTYGYSTSHTFTPLLIGAPPKVADVVATGERSVEFRLERPNETFLQMVLGTMPIVPEHIFSTISDPMGTVDERVLVSTGPYSLSSRNVAQGTESYLAKDGYFLGRPYVRRIEMVPFDDPLAALAIGELDGAAAPAEGARDEVLAPFRGHSEYGIISQPAGFGFPLFFNLTKGGPLADVRFRRACLHAIDRHDLVDRLLNGNGTVGSQGWLPPSNPFHDAAARDYPFDRGEAERLLDEAGYQRKPGEAYRSEPGGRPLRYTLHFADTVPRALADLTAASLEQVGIEIDLQVVDLVRLFGLKLGRAFDLLVTNYPGPSGIGLNADPDILRAVYHSTASSSFHSATGYASPELDRLLDAQIGIQDGAERRTVVSQIQKKVAEDLPVAMLYYTTFFYVFRKSVFDVWYYTPGGLGPGVPNVYNKHAYVTGRREGLEVRQQPSP